MGQGRDQFMSTLTGMSIELMINFDYHKILIASISRFMWWEFSMHYHLNLLVGAI